MPQLADALRPLLVRSLVRDARFRLREVVRLRGEQQLPLGELPALLASYPDPDATPTPSLPQESFDAIDTALETLLSPMPVLSATQPDDPLDCSLDCHTLNLLWDVRNGSANVEQTVAGLDVTQLTRRAGAEPDRHPDQEPLLRATTVIDYATQQCLEGFGALDLPQQISGYKPRPLQGVWATPPFLHNGSLVPSLYQMLLPPAKRDQKFLRRSSRLRSSARWLRDCSLTRKVTMMGSGSDTTIPGNRNIGHGFAADADHLEQTFAGPEGESSAERRDRAGGSRTSSALRWSSI